MLGACRLAPCTTQRWSNRSLRIWFLLWRRACATARQRTIPLSPAAGSNWRPAGARASQLILAKPIVRPAPREPEKSVVGGAAKRLGQTSRRDRREQNGSRAIMVGATRALLCIFSFVFLFCVFTNSIQRADPMAQAHRRIGYSREQNGRSACHRRIAFCCRTRNWMMRASGWILSIDSNSTARRRAPQLQGDLASPFQWAGSANQRVIRSSKWSGQTSDGRALPSSSAGNRPGRSNWPQGCCGE